MIQVTKSILPDIKEYIAYIEGIWASGHLTNHGPLVLELEEKLKKYLGVKHLFFVNNGTIALQIAIKALGIKKEIITTPFSYVATTSSICWEGCKPIFADINASNFTISSAEIEKKITSNTEAILATHVFGIPCEVEKIQEIATKNNLKIIYDAAHAFGVKYKKQSILNFGDISTLSFHATKLFHTIEGGAIICNDDDLAHKISYMRNFGHNGQEAFWGLGINGKNCEFHAAMGLALFPKINWIIENRTQKLQLYDSILKKNPTLFRPEIADFITYNAAYYPIVFESEEILLTVKKILNENQIYPRRYFYPSLTTLNYIEKMECKFADNISKKILCLPLYPDIENEIILKICNLILNNIQQN
ncbi:MAG: DegT/DnrJ/EryC1/StrS family aminotransferase [Bacteroidetes bacterium]|nr:MAG: DegT/DnrJ/EryC1/StrS family aminotransferase [Bacteroidota bacterium]